MKTINKRKPGRPPSKKGQAEPRLKDTILKETILVLSEMGIPNFSLKEVSRRANITPAAIYYYFGNKKALIVETLDRYLVPLMKTFFQAMGNTESSPVETLKELQDAILAGTKNSPWFLPLWSREICSVNGTLRNYLRERIAPDAHHIFMKKIIKGQKDKTINEGVLPEMAYLSIIANTLLPLVSKPSWEEAWNLDIDPVKLETHVRTVAMNGFLTKDE
jgi:AcrR family transcriptional regulator